MLRDRTIGLVAALAASVAAGAAIAATAPASAPAAKPAAATATKPAAVAPKGPSDKAQIEALEKGFAAAFNAKDVDKIMSYYARQGLFVFDVTPPRQHVGWDDYKKDWEGFLGPIKGGVKFELSDLDITVVGSVAYSHSIQNIHTSSPDSDLVVRVTDVYRKSGGKWRIVQEHVSVPVDVDTGKADLLSKP
ncbi:MAG TPA: nuclear transport factor 2 family protein [Caulobacteraceae bacterium]|nr:nuclear transport factor 2 family protein [Caulobacteraceae bacterium]